MDGLALGAGGFIDDALEEGGDGGVGERGGLDGLGMFQDLALGVGLIERKILGVLELGDFEGAAGTLVEEFNEFAVDFIDLAAPIGESHGATSRRERPWVAACLRERTRWASAAAAASIAAGECGSDNVACSISATSAEPTTAASARPPRTGTGPGRGMPKPTAMGGCVTAAGRRSRAGRSSGRASLAPVTPVREMR